MGRSSCLQMLDHDKQPAGEATVLPSSALSTLARVGLLATISCLGFTAVGAGTLAAMHLLPDVPTEPGQVLKLIVKSVLFAIAALATGYALRFLPSPSPKNAPLHAGTTAPTWRTRIGLTLALVLAIALSVPNLGALPSLQPDETHHLLVARNLAIYGKYASGHPDKGFNYRDPYDSVGPSVLAPVAGAFYLAGNNVAAAREVIALYYLALCMALYLLFKPVFGPAAAISGLFMLQCAFGTVYLARTLYGEVPALFYLCLSLLLWRCALARQGASWWGFFAGVAFALMVDCKAFLFISLWAILATCAYDRITLRRVRSPHLVLPALGFASAILVVHFAMATFPSPSGASITQTLAYYEHYLMFGFVSVPKTLAWISGRPLETFGAILAMLAAITVLFRRRQDPSLATLYFLAPLLAYWWVFFTPGNIPRYMFYTCAIAAMFAGALVWNMIMLARDSQQSVSKRAGATALSLMLCLAAVMRCWPEFKSVYASDEMKDDRDLAAYVAALPKEATVATTHWPLEKLLMLLSDRYVPLLSSSSPAPDQYSIVIAFPPTDALAAHPALHGQTPDLTIGPYVIVFYPVHPEP